MADLAPTSVQVTSSTQKRDGTLGATLSEGDAVYSDSTDSDHLKGAESTTNATVVGVLITEGDDGDASIYATGGDIELIGVTMAIGTTYHLSTNAGKITADAIPSGKTVTNIGVAETATKLKLKIHNTGVAHA